MRVALRLLPAFLLLLAAAGPARADEVIVLDNGAVLRGEVIEETEEGLLLRLIGYAEEARIRIAPERIVRRFVTVARRDPSAPATGGTPDWSARAERVEEYFPTDGEGPRGALPAEEPSPRGEGFFHRLARVAVLSVPADNSARVFLAGLFFVALLALVGLGARLAEIESLGFARTGALALLLGLMLGLDAWFHADLLRADRAAWVLPLQGALWLLAALGLLRCGFGRVVLLFAFVLFSLAVIVFTAGAILVNY